MSSRIKYLCLLLSFLPLFSVSAASVNQNIKFQHFRLEDGLSQNSVSCITQDSRGYMWFGTRDGLNKFDGYNFKIYKTDLYDTNSISENQITSVAAGKDGYIWIGGATTGLNRLDPVRDNFYRFKHIDSDPYSLSSDEVTVIYESSDGVLWVGTDSGLNRKESASNRFKHYFFSSGDDFRKDAITCINEDSYGNIWVGAQGGLFKLDKDGRVEKFRHDKYNPFTLPSNFINAIEFDTRGFLWVGTDEGLSKYNYSTGKFITYQHIYRDGESLRDNYVQAILRDGDGKLWVGTRDGGLNMFNEKDQNFTVLRKAVRDYLSLGSNNILCFYQDNSGGIWVGTKGGGVSRHNKSFFSYLVPSFMTWTIYETIPGKIWIGAEEGLYLLDMKDESIKSYYPSFDGKKTNSIAFKSVAAMAEDKRGNLWIGGALEGLDIFNPLTNRFTHVDLVKELGDNMAKFKARCFLSDDRGNMWIGSANKGLIKYDGKTKKYSVYPLSLEKEWAGTKILSLHQDKKGYIWIGTMGEGLIRLNPLTGKTLRFLNNPLDKNSLNDNSVLSIYESADGILWFGSYNGLNKFDPASNTFAHYTEKEGLPNNLIYGILEDKNGNIWVSTNNGLAMLNPKTKVVKSFDVNSGLLSNEFNSGAILKSKSGLLFFGGINGIVYFNPDSVFYQKVPPPPQIIKFSIFGKETKFKEEIADLRKIEISYKDKFISFEFLSLDYNNINKVRYAYKLDGFDKEWVESGLRRVAYYTNLNGGDYIFRVRAYNNQVHESPRETSIRLSIAPPYYSTWPFRILLAVVLMAALYAFLKYKVRNVEKQNKNLSRLVEEKTRLFNEISVLNYNLEEEIREREKAEQALVQSEETMRNLVENQGEGIVVADVDENFTFANPAAEEIFGTEPGRLVGRNMREFVSEEEFVKISQQTALRAAGEKGVYEISISRQDGQKRDLHITATPNFDEAGKFEGSFGIILDITERKRIERALVESENRFRVASETSPFVIFIYRGDKFIYVNSAAELITGYTKAELMQINFWDLIHPAYRDDLRARGYARQKNESVPQRYEFKIIRKDGTERWVDFSGSYIEIQGLPAALGAAVDINDRKVYEEEIKRLSQFMNLAVENINVWFHVSDINLNVVVWNKAAEVISGYSSAEVVGSNQIWDMLSPEGDSKIGAVMRSLHEKSTSLDDFETMIKTNSGEEKLISWNAKSLMNNEGKIIGSVAFGRDVTIKKKYEIQLIEAKEIAERSNRLKSEFLAQMSHEIRSPINIILSFASLLREEMEGNISDELKIGFESIEKGGQRIIRTVDMILNMSEITAGYFELNPVPMDLQESILKDLMDEYIPAAKHKGLRILYEDHSDCRMISADVFSITQIFSNLIDNAIKYTEKGYVKIKLYNEPGFLYAEVKDTGIGIKKEYIPTLFDPFTQEEAGYTRKFDGNGLGLALVKKYITLNNAEITVESEKGKGSAFILKFPLL